MIDDAQAIAKQLGGVKPDDEWLGNQERAKQLLVMPIGIDKSHSRKWDKH